MNYYLIDHLVVDQILDICQNHKDNNPNSDTNVCTVMGYQSGNLVSNKELHNIVMKFIRDRRYLDFKLRWLHYIDYDEGGYQKSHNHEKTEKLSFILYLTDCQMGGETVISDGDTEYKFLPQKGRLIVFNAKNYHSAMPTIDKKKVLVGALVYV